MVLMFSYCYCFTTDSPKTKCYMAKWVILLMVPNVGNVTQRQIVLLILLMSHGRRPTDSPQPSHRASPNRCWSAPRSLQRHTSAFGATGSWLLWNTWNYQMLLAKILMLNIHTYIYIYTYIHVYTIYIYVCVCIYIYIYTSDCQNQNVS